MDYKFFVFFGRF